MAIIDHEFREPQSEGLVETEIPSEQVDQNSRQDALPGVRKDFVEKWIKTLSDEALSDAARVLAKAEKVQEMENEAANDDERKAVRDGVKNRFGGASNLSKYKKIAEAAHLWNDIQLLPSGLSQIYELSQLSQDVYEKAKADGRVTPETTRDDILEWKRANTDGTNRKPSPGSFSLTSDKETKKVVLEIILRDGSKINSFLSRARNFANRNNLTTS